MKSSALVLVAGVVWFLSACCGFAAEEATPVGGDAPAKEEAAFRTFMDAVVGNDYEAFVSAGTPAFRTQISEEQFTAVTTQLEPYFKDGYQAQYLTVINQSGLQTYLWKISPATGEMQFLVRLMMKDGAAAGFWIQ